MQDDRQVFSVFIFDLYFLCLVRKGEAMILNKKGFVRFLWATKRPKFQIWAVAYTNFGRANTNLNLYKHIFSL